MLSACKGDLFCRQTRRGHWQSRRPSCHSLKWHLRTSHFRYSINCAFILDDIYICSWLFIDSNLFQFNYSRGEQWLLSIFSWCSFFLPKQLNTGLLIMKIAAAWILMSCEPIRFQIDEREGKKSAKPNTIWFEKTMMPSMTLLCCSYEHSASNNLCETKQDLTNIYRA